MSLRKFINKYIKKYGYEITKESLFFLALNNLAKQKRLLFLQVGANDGVKFDGLYSFVRANNCSGVVVEPIRYYFEKLVENYSFTKDVKPVNFAICPDAELVDIYYVDPSKLDCLEEWSAGIGSLDPNHHKKSGTSSEYMISDKVPCVHLMHLIEKESLTDLDLLQIDVEGFDYEVLKMLDFNSCKPKIVKFEHNNLKKSVRKKAYKLLKDNGYQLHREKGDSIAILNALRKKFF